MSDFLYLCSILEKKYIFAPQAWETPPLLKFISYIAAYAAMNFLTNYLHYNQGLGGKL